MDDFSAGPPVPGAASAQTPAPATDLPPEPPSANRFGFPGVESPLAHAGEAPRLVVPRWLAAIEVFLLCGIPTQLLITTVIILFTNMRVDPVAPSLEFFSVLSFVDTALVALLIRLFLALSGESSHDVFIGRRRPLRELGLGLALVPVVIVAVGVLAWGLRTVFPSLHTVQENPLAAYMGSPLEAAVFAFVVIVAGGIREELQRAFILHRFRQSLGGVWVGLVLFSVLFGSLHYPQGLDAAVAIGVLGLFWGLLYIRRGSALASMSSHAGFDALQVLQVVLAKAFGS